MPTVIQDVRYALRLLGRSRGFAAAAVLSLALGIGANTAIFSVTHALLIQPLPYADSDRLVLLWNRSPGIGIAEDWFSTAQYFDVKNTHRGFEEVAIAVGANMNLTGDARPERVGVIRISSNLLPMLGVRPAHGRLLTLDDEVPGAGRAALLNHGTWIRRYGGDPSVVGQSLDLNGAPYEIVGVLPDWFSLPQEVLPTLGVVAEGEVLVPLQLRPGAADVRTAENYNIIGKLRRDVSVGDAQTEMDALTSRLRRDYPDIYPPNGGLTFSIVPLLEEVVGDVRRPLLVLGISVGFVLLIACANVANLLLSRAVARRKEMAVRVTLGASQRRVVRQLLTESLLLAFIGGGLGLVVALVAVQWVHVLDPPSIPRLQGIAINGEVLAVTVGLSTLAGVLFGLAPALGVFRLDLHRHLKEADRGTAGSGAVWGRGHTLRRLLVVAELALAVVLLIGAGLLIRSFASLQSVPAGFALDNVLTFELSLTGGAYADTEAVQRGYRDLWQRLEQVPGATLAGGVTTLPLSERFAWGPITVEGRSPPAGQGFINADMRTVAGRYFEAMEIPLIEGRLFDDRDRGGPRVAIVDDYMARQLWPDESALGKRFRFGDIHSTRPWETVVGVVGQVKHYGLDAVDTRIALYRPHSQSGARTLFVAVKTETEPAALTDEVRTALQRFDPDLPLTNVATMTDRLDRSLARRAFSMLLLAVFAGLAVVLAAIGTYGVLAYLVSQGSRDLGIRMALGAGPRAAAGLVLRQGMTLAVTGIVIGLAGAFGLARLMSSLLFGIEPTDAPTFMSVAVLLAAVALVASLLPARRASRIDPIATLRSE